MKRKLSKKAKIIISSVGVFLLVLGIIAYWAADRFLIEHVEMDLSKMPASYGNPSEPSSKDFQAAPSEDLQVTPGADLQVTSTGSFEVTPTGLLNVIPTESLKVASTGVPKVSAPKATPGNVAQNSPEKITITDTSYKSDSKSIEIKKVVTGQGADTVTYFVADIKLTNATQMKSAFAKNKFGRNIIEKTSDIAKANNAILAINGDYYGFREDGIEIRNGFLFRNEPSERAGLAFYKDGSMKIYDEKQANAEELVKNDVWNTISFGPVLIDNGKMNADFDDARVDFNIGSQPITGLQPRTGIGMIDKNHFIFVVVDGRNKGYSKGMELKDFAKVFQDLGCKVAYNIDGGGSATMYFNGKRLNNPCGKNDERGTSDIIYIK